jgi:hypothetical protein
MRVECARVSPYPKTATPKRKGKAFKGGGVWLHRCGEHIARAPPQCQWLQESAQGVSIKLSRSTHLF